jgi:hypothetical protein
MMDFLLDIQGDKVLHKNYDEFSRSYPSPKTPNNKKTAQK